MRHQVSSQCRQFRVGIFLTIAVGLGACSGQPATQQTSDPLPIIAAPAIGSQSRVGVIKTGDCQCIGTGPSGPVTVSCGQSACGQDYITYSCSADGWTYTGDACTGNDDAGVPDSGACACTGNGLNGPVTVQCGESACGQDYITYSCGAGGWSYTGQACSCSCTGVGPGGPVTVSCGQSACGQDYITYSCSQAGWSSTGQSCICSCTGTGPGNVPVTVNCGESACGSDNMTYSCGNAGWSATGHACNDNNDAGVLDSGNACQCNGTGPNGPVTVDCGQSACGVDNMRYSCSDSGWTQTGPCTACTCTGTGPGGVPVTIDCGQSTCGSDYYQYACSETGWSWTGNACP
jgi:hypothetical protein